MYFKVLGGLAVVLAVLAVGWMFRMQAQKPRQDFIPTPPDKAMETYLGLRKRALTASASAGLKNMGPDDPVVVLMDLNTGKRNATVAAYVDGTASIYISNGGGYLGGGQAFPSVHEAAQKLIAAGRKFKPQMHQTHDYPLPAPGEVFFYLVTDHGVYTVSAPEAELNRRTHPLTALYAAGQEVITQYRLNSK
jgi:hypothetical protein